MGLTANCEKRLVWRFAIVLLLCQLLLASCSGESMSNTPTPKPAEREFGVVNRHTGGIAPTEDPLLGLYRFEEELPAGDWKRLPTSSDWVLDHGQPRQLRLTARAPDFGIMSAFEKRSPGWMFDQSQSDRFLVGVTFSATGTHSKVVLGDIRGWGVIENGRIIQQELAQTGGGHVVIKMPPEVASTLRRGWPRDTRANAWGYNWDNASNWIFSLYQTLINSGVVFNEFWVILNAGNGRKAPYSTKEVGEFLLRQRGFQIAEDEVRVRQESGMDSRQSGVKSIVGMRGLATHWVWNAIYRSEVQVDRQLLRRMIGLYVDGLPEYESHGRARDRLARYLPVGLVSLCRAQYPNESWWQTPEVLAAIKAVDDAETARKAPDPEPADSKKD